MNRLSWTRTTPRTAVLVSAGGEGERADVDRSRLARGDLAARMKVRGRGGELKMFHHAQELAVCCRAPDIRSTLRGVFTRVRDGDVGGLRAEAAACLCLSKPGGYLSCGIYSAHTPRCTK